MGDDGWVSESLDALTSSASAENDGVGVHGFIIRVAALIMYEICEIMSTMIASKFGDAAKLINVAAAGGVIQKIWSGVAWWHAMIARR